LGQRTGISPDKTLLDIQNGDRVIDKSHRQKIEKEVKIIYRKNYDVLQKFKDKSSSKSKDKILDKTIQKSVRLKIPYHVRDEKSKISNRKTFKIVERFGYASRLKNIAKSKVMKDPVPKSTVNKRFNMASKSKEKSGRLKNYDVYKTINRNREFSPKEKFMEKDK